MDYQFKNPDANRIDWVDVARAIGIICVVIGHAKTYDIPLYHDLTLRKLIYSFHMPLFFFLSGLVKTGPGGGKKYFKAYFIPYISMMIISDGISIEKIIDYLFLKQSVLVRYTPLASWFLPCLILVNIMYDVTLNLRGLCKCETIKNAIEFFFLLLFFALAFYFDEVKITDALWYFNIAFIGAAYMGIGRITKKYLCQFLNKNKPVLITATGFVFALLGTVGAYFNPLVYFVLGKYGDYTLMLISSISWCMSICCLSKIINNSNFAHRFNLCTLKIQYLAVIQLS